MSIPAKDSYNIGLRPEAGPEQENCGTDVKHPAQRSAFRILYITTL
jgi:hypothetical protein